MGADVRSIVDTSLYSLEAIHRTCYAFGNRAHVRMERTDDQHAAVIFAQLGADPLAEEIVAQFERALTDFQIRADLNRETTVIRDLIFRQAFVEADL